MKMDIMNLCRLYPLGSPLLFSIVSYTVAIFSPISFNISTLFLNFMGLALDYFGIASARDIFFFLDWDMKRHESRT